MAENPWKTINPKVVYKNKFGYQLRDDEVINPGGKKSSYIFLEKLTTGVCVLPVDSSGIAYLLSQWRYPIDKLSLEIPAGGVEVGETPLKAAQRELLEEVGFSAKMTHVGHIYEANFITKIKTFIFLATDLRQGPNNPDTSEKFDVLKYPLKEVLNMIKNNQIDDPRTSHTVLLVKELQLLSHDYWI